MTIDESILCNFNRNTNPMKKTLFSLLFTLVTCFLSAQVQNTVNGKIVAPDSARIQVIRIFPDSFPRVSVIFKASTPSGQPLWNLNDSNTAIQEDGKNARIVSVEKISKTKTINTALVIDHSGSMSEDERIRQWWATLPPSAFTNKRITVREYTDGEVNSDSMMTVRISPPFPDDLHEPIWYAKRAAISYLNSVDPAKDPISVIGFSDNVDKTLPLSKNQSSVNGTINGLFANGGTAFYDAISSGLDQVRNAEGIKVVIALTDGKDNASRKTLSSVISKAQADNIPVYVIGLGDVDKTVLKKLANQTGGQAFFTDDPARLASIYIDISRQIQSVYELIYTSENLASADTTRDIMLQFDIEGQYHNTRSIELNLPDEVRAFLYNKEQNIAAPPAASDNSPIWPYVAGITVAALGVGVLIARSSRNQKKKNLLQIIRIFPNPANGPVTIELNTTENSIAASVIVTDSSGQIVLQVPYSAGGSSFDAGQLANGKYLIQVQNGTEMSPAQTLIVSH